MGKPPCLVDYEKSDDLEFSPPQLSSSWQRPLPLRPHPTTRLSPHPAVIFIADVFIKITINTIITNIIHIRDLFIDPFHRESLTCGGSVFNSRAFAAQEKGIHLEVSRNKFKNEGVRGLLRQLWDNYTAKMAQPILRKRIQSPKSWFISHKYHLTAHSPSSACFYDPPAKSVPCSAERKDDNPAKAWQAKDLLVSSLALLLQFPLQFSHHLPQFIPGQVLAFRQTCSNRSEHPVDTIALTNKFAGLCWVRIENSWSPCSFPNLSLSLIAIWILSMSHQPNIKIHGQEQCAIDHLQ